MSPRAVGLTLAVAAAAAAAAPLGCLWLRDVDSLTSHEPDTSVADGGDGGDARTNDGSVSDGSTDAPLVGDGAVPCPGTAGPAGVRVGAYCIDATEVTVKHYRAFLAAKAGNTGGQVAACAWNTSYQPLDAPLGTEFDDYPIFKVDHCDALAYCAWAGKHLCGAIDGAPLTTAEATNAARSEWYRACSGNADGVHDYPYGQGYDPLVCNGVDRDAGVLPVGTLPGCVGAYEGVHDLSGNLREWEDACDDGATPADRACMTRGGAFYDIGGTLACANRQMFNATAQNIGIGFRCCAR